jgi:hypothetical protein
MHYSLELDSVRRALAYSAFAAAFLFIMTVVAFGQPTLGPIFAPAADLADPAALCSLAGPRRLG